MGRYFQKPNPILTVTKDEAVAALALLREELDAVQTSFTTAVKRLMWFRDMRGFKHLGYGSFAQFLKHELGRSRWWMWQHAKTLPLAEYETKLLTAKCRSGLHCNNDEPHSDADNAVLCNNDKTLVLTHKQRLEVTKLDGISQMRVMPVLMEKCPGADVETTRKVIDEALGKATPKPTRDKSMDAVFDADDSTEVRDAVRTVLSQLREAVETGSDLELSNVIASSMQALRGLRAKLA